MVLLQLINQEWLVLLSSLLGGGATGGVISAVINHKENRRIKRGEARLSEAVAKREDASAASEMLGVLERSVAHSDKRITQLEQRVERELKWRCEVVACDDRMPPLGSLTRGYHA